MWSHFLNEQNVQALFRQSRKYQFNIFCCSLENNKLSNMFTNQIRNHIYTWFEIKVRLMNRYIQNVKSDFKWPFWDVEETTCIHITHTEPRCHNSMDRVKISCFLSSLSTMTANWGAVKESNLMFCWYLGHYYSNQCKHQIQMEVQKVSAFFLDGCNELIS